MRTDGHPMTRPTSPIELTGARSRWSGAVDVPRPVRDELARICPVVDDEQELAERSRDWWPLALHWSLAGEVPARAAVAVRPASTEQVAAVVRVCAAHALPLTVAGGRSGVTGASVPVFGGVLLDITGLSGLGDVDATSGVVEVLAGTFGPDLEQQLQERPRPERRPLPAELRDRHRRRLGRLPWRGPVLHPLRQDRGPRRRSRGRAGRRHGRAHGRGAGRRRRTRPHPAVRRVGGHARRRHAGVVAGPPAARR